MFGFVEKIKGNMRIKKPRVKKARAKVARVVDGYVKIQDFEPDCFEPFEFEPDTMTLDQSINLARSRGVPEDDIIHDLEECDKYFLN